MLKKVLIALSVVTPLLASPSEAIALHPSAKRSVESVLRAAAKIRSDDSEESRNAFDAVFDPLLNCRSSASDEALAALLSFYLGEHPGEDLTCELIARGKVVLPLLQKFRSPEIAINKEVAAFPVENKSAEYEALIARIKSGEHCEREP